MSLLKDKIELRVLEAELGTQKALNRMPLVLRWMTIAIVLGSLPMYFVSKSIVKNVLLKKYQYGIIKAKPSFTNPLPAEVGDVMLTTLGQGIYSAIVKITNPNLDLSADNISYSFKFYSSGQQLLFSSPEEKLFLLPNESKYITLPRFTVQEPISYANFEIAKDIQWQKRLSIPKVQLLTSIPTPYYQFSPQAFVLEGDFTNKSAYSLKQVRLTFVLIGMDKEIVGVNRRDEFTVRPFERRAYKQLWPNLSAGELYNVEVYAETNTLDPTNLSATVLPSGSASDLSRPQ